ncbi:extracellular solute-binding protein [Aeromicrobium sp. 9AM]|uniref:extracellular solute-binding protein n=1 Tax=Aeromicrobium sp. 9AM TaxID=2653126 RepID=UPI0012F41279|nr:extracellular solute-binding protein [Aeromicrobium sp. 9AM]VXB62496.1 Bacterial extracellular solute-binding protein [Aeromicrobium sp. 9AM]
MNRTPRSSRRRATAALTGLALLSSLALSACGASPASGKTTLTFASFGGAYSEAQKKAWVDAYTKANPDVKIVMDSPVDQAKIKAMVESGNVTWDVVDVNGDFGLDSHKALLEPIDCTVVTTCDAPSPGMTNSKYRVAENVTTFAVGYDADRFETEPTSYKDFFDVDTYPGKRGLWKLASGGALELALLADGVAPDKLYPLDVDRALKKLKTIEDNIIWYDSPPQGEDILASGEATMVLNFAARPYDLATRLKKPTKILWDAHIDLGSYLVVPKGSKHADEAMKFIAWVTDPAHNAEITKHYPLGPGSAAALPKADKSKAEWLATSHADTGVGQDDQYWDQNFGSVNDKFQAWLTK